MSGYPADTLWVNANPLQTDLCRDPGYMDMHSSPPWHWIPASLPAFPRAALRGTTSLLGIRDAARPALHSHAARGNEGNIRYRACRACLINQGAHGTPYSQLISYERKPI